MWLVRVTILAKRRHRTHSVAFDIPAYLCGVDMPTRVVKAGPNFPLVAKMPVLGWGDTGWDTTSLPIEKQGFMPLVAYSDACLRGS